MHQHYDTEQCTYFAWVNPMELKFLGQSLCGGVVKYVDDIPKCISINKIGDEFVENLELMVSRPPESVAEAGSVRRAPQNVKSSAKVSMMHLQYFFIKLFQNVISSIYF